MRSLPTMPGTTIRQASASKPCAPSSKHSSMQRATRVNALLATAFAACMNRRSTTLLRALLCTSLLLPGFAWAYADCDDLSGLPINFNVRWSDVWQALNNEAPCTQNCHLGSDPTGDLNLGSLQLSVYFLVNQPSSQNPAMLRVEPGNPRWSLFFQKVSCTQPKIGGPMPPPNGHLSRALQGMVYDWIEQGAYGEPTEDPIPRDFVFRDSIESIRR